MKKTRILMEKYSIVCAKVNPSDENNNNNYYY